MLAWVVGKEIDGFESLHGGGISLIGKPNKTWSWITQSYQLVWREIGMIFWSGCWMDPRFIHQNLPMSGWLRMGKGGGKGG